MQIPLRHLCISTFPPVCRYAETCKSVSLHQRPPNFYHQRQSFIPKHSLKQNLRVKFYLSSFYSTSYSGWMLCAEMPQLTKASVLIKGRQTSPIRVRAHSNSTSNSDRILCAVIPRLTKPSNFLLEPSGFVELNHQVKFHQGIYTSSLTPYQSVKHPPPAVRIRTESNRITKLNSFKASTLPPLCLTIASNFLLDLSGFEQNQMESPSQILSRHLHFLPYTLPKHQTSSSSRQDSSN